MLSQFLAQRIYNPQIIPSIRNFSGWQYLQRLYPILLVLAIIISAVVFVLIIVIGGVQWITSGGERAGVEGARRKIINGVTGLFLLLLVFFVIIFIGKVFKVNLLGPYNLQTAVVPTYPTATSIPTGTSYPTSTPGPTNTPIPVTIPITTNTPTPTSLPTNTPAVCLGCVIGPVCYPGTSDTACGIGGYPCAICQTGYSCISHVCTLLTPTPTIAVTSTKSPTQTPTPLPSNTPIPTPTATPIPTPTPTPITLFCYDSDGGQVITQRGTVTDNSTLSGGAIEYVTDYCASPTSVNEYFCNGVYRSQVVSQCIGISGGTCFNGACCSWVGQSCSTDNDCCTNYVCQGGLCVSPNILLLEGLNTNCLNYCILSGFAGCAGIGTDNLASNGMMYLYQSGSCVLTNLYNCNTVLYATNSVCGGHQTDWTRCRCVGTGSTTF